MKRVLGLIIAATCLLGVPSLTLAGDEGKPADKAKDKGKAGDKKQGDKKAEGKAEGKPEGKEDKSSKGW